jgi:hypothetical protein
LCNFVNHAMVYVTAITSPLIGATLTRDPIIVGLFMTPVTMGTVVGSLLGGRVLKGKVHPEFRGIVAGMLLNLCSSAAFGWSAMQSCADNTLIPNDFGASEVGPVVAASSSSASGSGVGEVEWGARPPAVAKQDAAAHPPLGHHVSSGLSMVDVDYRLHHKLLCEDWAELPLLLAGLSSLILGFGASLMMIASST